MSQTAVIPARTRGARLARVALVVLALAAGSIACSDAYEETGPSDTIVAGQLCLPASQDCASQRLLHRTASLGANRLDFVLTNEAGAAEVVVAALPRAGDSEADASATSSDAASAADGGAGDSDQVAPLVERTYTLQSGESVNDRFVREQLFSSASFSIRMDCQGCQARLDYTLASEPLECRGDDDCSGAWLCSESAGRCVECLDDGDCGTNQTCSSSGRCSPERSSGCAHHHESTGLPGGWAWWLVAAALGLMALSRRQLHTLSALGLVVFVVGALPATGQAQSPTAGLNVGLGPRILTGSMGEHTDRGIGLSVSQELRSTYVGGRLELGANYYLTTQPSPPLSRELQLYTVTLGPQAYLPVGPTRLVFGLDYRHVGLVSNSLVRITGPEVNHHSAGATMEVRYRFAPFEAIVRGGYHPIFGLDSAMMTFDVALGIATR